MIWSYIYAGGMVCDSIRNGHADAPRVADNPQIDISGLNWTFWVWV